MDLSLIFSSFLNTDGQPRLPQSPTRKTAPINTHTLSHRQSAADTFKEAERRKSLRERSRSAYVSLEEVCCVLAYVYDDFQIPS